MPEQSKYITASCKLVNGLVYKDGEIYFTIESNSSSEFLLSVYRQLKIEYPKFHKMDTLSKLGLLATEILLKDNFVPGKYGPDEVSVVLCNANASLEADLNYWQSVKNIPSPALFVYTLPNIVIGEICIRHNFKGENAFFIQRDFDADFLTLYASNLLDHQGMEMCICGWVEVIGGAGIKAVLFLVEKEQRQGSLPFTINHLNKLYESANG